VYAISHSPSKKDDALAMGASHFITTNEKDWAKPYKFKFDFIINTTDATDRFHLPDYFSTLNVNGIFHNAGYPDNPLPQLMVQDFGPNGCMIGASHLGNRQEMEAMFELASKLNIKSWVQTIDISEAGLKEALERVHKGDRVRYRFTMVGYDKVFGKRT
jgi:alcohol dehydrogenase (NADP+)